MSPVRMTSILLLVDIRKHLRDCTEVECRVLLDTAGETGDDCNTFGLISYNLQTCLW